MGEIVNLRKVRKAKARAEAEASAAENRIRHGRTAAERARDALEAEQARRTLDGAKHDDAGVLAPNDQAGSGRGGTMTYQQPAIALENPGDHGLSDWRGEMLEQVRRLIREAAPDVVEEVKWRKPSNPAGVPVWSHAGMLCTGETYKDKVKLTFAKGAQLDDPSGLFNSSLDGQVRRAIDLAEGAALDGMAFKSLIVAAMALNSAKPRQSSS